MPGPTPLPPTQAPAPTPASGGPTSAGSAKKSALEKELRCVDFKTGEAALKKGLECAPSQLKGFKAKEHPAKQHKDVFPSPDWPGIRDADAALLGDIDRLAKTRAKSEAQRKADSALGKVHDTAKRNAKKRIKDAGPDAALDGDVVFREEAQKLGVPDVQTLQVELLPSMTTRYVELFPERAEYWFNRYVRQAGSAALMAAEKKVVADFRAKKLGDKTFEAAMDEAHSAAVAKADTTLSNELPGVKRGFVVAEEERIKFDFGRLGYPRLEEPTGYDPSTLSKPSAPKGQSNSEPVGAEVNDLLDAIDNSNFRATTYKGHSWGPYSIDISLLDGRDERGFFKHESAVEFFLALDQGAAVANVTWRALYNDFEVAKEVNERLQSGRITFLEDHGPAPYVLHIHVDVKPLGSLPEPAPAPTPTPSSDGGQP